MSELRFLNKVEQLPEKKYDVPLPVTPENLADYPDQAPNDDHSFHAKFKDPYSELRAAVAWSEDDQAYVAQWNTGAETIPMLLTHDRIEAEHVFEVMCHQIRVSFGHFNLDRLKEGPAIFKQEDFEESIQHKKTEEKLRRVRAQACERMRQWVENNPPIEALRYAVNQWLRAGEFAYNEHLLAAFQKLNNPIVIDFNGVLANEDVDVSGLRWNPEATTMLERLQEIGEIVVVTVARDKKTSPNASRLQDFFLQHGWGPDQLILVTQTNYIGTDDPSAENLQAEQKERQQKVIKTYLYNHPELHHITDHDFLNAGPSEKRVAPLFNRDTPPVIIDDSWPAVNQNPGMNGFWVKPWFTGDEPDYSKRSHENALPLADAIRATEEYYQ